MKLVLKKWLRLPKAQSKKTLALTMGILGVFVDVIPRFPSVDVVES